MKCNSNFVHFNSDGDIIADVVNQHDPFTQLTYGIATKPGFINVLSNRNCTCDDCYVEMQCNTCTRKDECDLQQAGCLLYDPYPYKGPSSLIFNMLELPFIVEKEDNVKSIPAILPYIPMYILGSKPHEYQYNLLCTEESPNDFDKNHKFKVDAHLVM